MRRIFVLLAVLSLGSVAAQERFERVARRNPWNGGGFVRSMKHTVIR